MTNAVILYGLAVATNLVFQTNVDLFHREIARYGLTTPVAGETMIAPGECSPLKRPAGPSNGSGKFGRDYSSRRPFPSPVAGVRLQRQRSMPSFTGGLQLYDSFPWIPARLKP